jgi:hypothetical protein
MGESVGRRWGKGLGRDRGKEKDYDGGEIKRGRVLSRDGEERERHKGMGWQERRDRRERKRE